jgi:hypothetical protein
MSLYIYYKIFHIIFHILYIKIHILYIYVYSHLNYFHILFLELKQIARGAVIIITITDGQSH